MKHDQEIIHCVKCPRLRRHCLEVARVKRRQYRDENYWGKPVPGFGDPKARLWIVGLAPAAHGANRTGRVFTGDSSGDWLYRELNAAGFATQPTSISIDDGLKLKDAFISSAGRCAPPDNKPTLEELDNCAPFLEADFTALKRVSVVLVLGKIAFDRFMKLAKKEGLMFEGKPVFGHGNIFREKDLTLLCSYHPSRQNTQTGRLTRAMWAKIFQTARAEL